MKGKISKILLLAIILIIACIVLWICIVSRNKQSVYINEKKSYLSDFSIVGDEVQIVCYLTICNTYDTDKIILVKGDFSNEVENGLISDEILYAIDSDKNKCQYMLQPKEEKSFYVTFIGKFAGTDQMTSRQLPLISIEEVSQ